MLFSNAGAKHKTIRTTYLFIFPSDRLKAVLHTTFHSSTRMLPQLSVKVYIQSDCFVAFLQEFRSDSSRCVCVYTAYKQKFLCCTTQTRWFLTHYSSCVEFCRVCRGEGTGPGRAGRPPEPSLYHPFLHDR